MKRLFALLPVVLCLVCFSSCGDDDETPQPAYLPFTGKWLIKDQCGANEFEYELMIGASYGNDSTMFIYNLNNFGYASGATANLISADSFVIPLQKLRGYNISGSGYLTGDNDSLYLNWVGGPNGNCSGVGRLTDQ